MNFRLIGLIVIMIIFSLSIFLGTIALENYRARTDCKNMSDNGYDTKIVNQIFLYKECWVKSSDANRFMEYSKWRSFGE